MNTIVIKQLRNAFATGLLAFFSNAVIHLPLFAQGQDSTVADRDIVIMAELLPGLYNNANQSYFDVRLNVEKSKQHAFRSVQITRLEDSDFSGFAFLLTEQGKGSNAQRQSVMSFSVDYDMQAVRMKTYFIEGGEGKPSVKKADYANGCDLLWRQEAGQFRGRSSANQCVNNIPVARDMMLSKDALWFSTSDQSNGVVDDHFALDRARMFSCYADLPGVGGGRDIPFKRYQINNIHDLGGEKWFTTDQGQELGINLFRVMWTFNNLDGVFTRPSLVVYVKTKEANGDVKEVGYAWTESNAQRIGINLKWMLVNCYMVSNEDVVPFYKTDEPRI